MPYRDYLNRWLVVRLLPNMQRKVVARCRTQSEADGHVQILNRLMPKAQFVTMFDPRFNYPTLLRWALRRRFVESGDCIYRPAQFRIPEKAFGFTFIRRRIRDS